MYMEFSFNIGDQEYTIPSVLTLELFERAMAWDITELSNHKPFVSALSGCPSHKLALLDSHTFELILGVCVSRLPQHTDHINRQQGVYTLKDFNNFTFGDFIDIDIMIADGMIIHAVELTAKLYGMPVDHAAKIPVERVWNTLMAIVKHRELVYKEHSEFFNLESQGSSDDTKMSIGHLQLMWYEAVLVLAEHQFLNIQHVVERPYKEALNFLTWKKNEIAKQQLEQVKRKYDLQKRSR